MTRQEYAAYLATVVYYRLGKTYFGTYHLYRDCAERHSRGDEVRSMLRSEAESSFMTGCGHCYRRQQKEERQNTR